MLVFRLITAGLCSAALIWLSLLFQRSTWPTVSAQVRAARVADASQGRKLARFELAYRWSGQDRHTTLDSDFSSGSLVLIEEELGLHPVGSTLAVSLDPDDPKRAFWVPFRSWESSLGPLVLFSAGLLFWAVPESVLWLVERKVHPGRAACLMFCGMGVLFGLLGAGLIGARAHVLQSWPQARARILRAERIPVGRGLSSIRLHCSYSVQGSALEGQAISTLKSVNPTLDGYPEGATIDIHYWPAHPEVFDFRAAWTPGYFGEGLIFSALSLIMLGAGGLFFRFARG